jgi:hypothetical protein
VPDLHRERGLAVVSINLIVARYANDVANTFAFEMNRAIVESKMTRRKISVRAGHDKGWVSRQLTRGRNLRLRNMVRMAYAAGYRLRVTLERIECE